MKKAILVVLFLATMTPPADALCRRSRCFVRSAVCCDPVVAVPYVYPVIVQEVLTPAFVFQVNAYGVNPLGAYSYTPPTPTPVLSQQVSQTTTTTTFQIGTATTVGTAGITTAAGNQTAQAQPKRCLTEDEIKELIQRALAEKSGLPDLTEEPPNLNNNLNLAPQPGLNPPQEFIAYAQNACFQCHSGEHPKKGLTLFLTKPTSIPGRVEATWNPTPTKVENNTVVPVTKEEIYRVCRDGIMPPAGMEDPTKRVPPNLVALLEQWAKN